MPDSRQETSSRSTTWARLVQRILPAVVLTCLLFLSLATAGLAKWAHLVPTTVDLSVVKGDANPSVRPGGTLVYRIFYQNSGDTVARDIRITDTLPAHTIHLFDDAAADGWTVTFSEQTIIWQKEALSPSQSGAFDVLLKVDVDAPASTSLINQVVIGTSAQESTLVNNSWSTQPTVIRVADVHVSKSGSEQIRAGDRITYTINYQNQGSEPADNVTITDTLPTGIAYVSSAGDFVASPTINGQQIVWDLGTLITSSTARVTLIGQVSNDQPSHSTLTNTVSIGTQTPERDFSDNLATASSFVLSGPPSTIQVNLPMTVPANLSADFTTLVLDRWDRPVANGTEVRFEGSARVSPALSAVTTNGVAMATVRAGKDIGPAVITATAGSAQGVGTFQVTAGPVGELRLVPMVGSQIVGNPVELRTAVFDSHGNFVDAGVPVSFTTSLGTIDPAMTHTDANGIVTTSIVATQIGTALISAYSAGFDDSTLVRFDPAATANISMTAEFPMIPIEGHATTIFAQLTDQYGNLVGDNISIGFESSLGTVNPVTTTTIAGRATTVLTSGQIHGTSSVTATVGAFSANTGVEFMPADLQIESTHSPTSDIEPGTEVTYSISFENIGAAIARNILITNTLPAGMIETSFESDDVNIVIEDDSKYVWSVDEMAPGDQGTVILRGTFDPTHEWPASQLVANLVSIATSSADGNLRNNTTSSANVIITANVYVQRQRFVYLGPLSG